MAFIDTFIAFLPVQVLLLGVVCVLLADIYIKNRGFATAVTVLSLVGAILAAFAEDLAGTSFTSDYLAFGTFYQAFAIIGLSASVIVAFSALSDLSFAEDIGVFYSLLLLSNIGGLLIAASTNFIPAYIGFELMAIPTYGMVAYKTRNRPAAEAAMKLFLLGALSSAIIVYGLSLLYGATGSLMYNTVTITGEVSGLQIAASIFLAAGTAFKLGLVPFHWWISDVYSGAPISVVNYLAAASKKMAFAFVFGIFLFGIPDWSDYWGPLVAAMAIITMVIGNAMATIQNRVMRIIAYSSVAQAGYISIALASFALSGDAAGQNVALTAGIIHIVAHVIMKGAAIAAVVVVVDSFGNDHIENFRGLIHKDVWVGGSLVLALFSLMGIPPLGGFIGKYLLFFAAVQTETALGFALAAALVVGSVISIYYYARIVRIVVDDPTSDIPVKPNTPLRVLLVALSVLTIAFALFMGLLDTSFTFF